MKAARSHSHTSKRSRAALREAAHRRRRKQPERERVSPRASRQAQQFLFGTGRNPWIWACPATKSSTKKPRPPDRRCRSACTRVGRSRPSTVTSGSVAPRSRDFSIASRRCWWTMTAMLRPCGGPLRLCEAYFSIVMSGVTHGAMWLTYRSDWAPSEMATGGAASFTLGLIGWHRASRAAL